MVVLWTCTSILPLAVRIIKRKRLSNLLCLPVSVQLSKEPDRSFFLFLLKDRVICFFVLKDGYINLKCSLNKLNSFLLVVLTEILTFSLTVCIYSSLPCSVCCSIQVFSHFETISLAWSTHSVFVFRPWYRRSYTLYFVPGRFVCPMHQRFHIIII